MACRIPVSVGYLTLADTYQDGLRQNTGELSSDPNGKINYAQ
jgi:hypothetical protein